MRAVVRLEDQSIGRTKESGYGWLEECPPKPSFESERHSSCVCAGVTSQGLWREILDPVGPQDLVGQNEQKVEVVHYRALCHHTEVKHASDGARVASGTDP